MAENNYCVYMHTNKINNKKYIGLTNNISRRWSRNGSEYRRQRFYYAIQKYGWDNFEHEILFDNLSKEEACKKEIEMITFYKTTNKKYGYNISSGGEDGHNDLWNDKEYRELQIKERKERWNNKEFRKHHSESMKIAMNKSDYKDKQAEITKNRWESGNFDEVHCKTVICLETGEIYKSITDASKLTNICRGDIGKCCLNQQKTASGYHWQYYSDELKLKENRKHLIDEIGSGHNKKIICVETGKIYNSIKEASKDIEIDNSSIGKAIKGSQETAGGYHWKIA